MSRYTLFFCIFLGFSCYGSETDLLDSDYYPKSQSTHGGIGLIQIPTARFSNDGEFTFGISTESPYNRLYAKVQAFPWLEAVLRYTEGTFVPYNPGSSQTWKDKGMDVKFRLFQEGDFFPAVALGFNDIGGQGSYSSEYIAASKRFNNVDLTVGLGWGRLGGLDHFDNLLGVGGRSYGAKGGGKLNLGRLFGGPYTSVFAGIEYTTPIPNLSLKLEYDTSDYSDVIGKEKVFDRTGDIFKVDSSFNFALNYQLNISQRDKADFSVGFVRGNTFYANLAVHTNLNIEGQPKYRAPPERLNLHYLPPFPELDPEWQKYVPELIMWQMGNEGLITHSIIFNGDEMQVEISQGRFQKPIQAIDLASRILVNNSPTNIETITVINMDMGVETLRASIPLDTLVEVVANGPLTEEYVVFNTAATANENAIIRDNDYLYPHFGWSIRPNLRGTMQHQIKFFFWQLEALIHAEYAIRKGLYLMADVGIDIASNFDDYTYHVPDGQLHHVRQDRRLYLTGQKSGLRKMALDYLFEINSNVTARITAGYLEWMYGGIGGEVLYMPEQKHWALGVDAYWVKQREFDQTFSFRDYQTVTGFVSFYYDLPFYEMRFKGSAGKFLGKDTGVTLDISRRFKTGARVGGMAAFTNCDEICVGEGSFTKWVYFTLPMDLFYVNSTTRSHAGYAWSPLTKDAGAKVEPGALYGLMTSAPDEVGSLRRKPWSMKKILSGFGTTSKKKI